MEKKDQYVYFFILFILVFNRDKSSVPDPLHWLKSYIFNMLSYLAAVRDLLPNPPKAKEVKI